VENAIARAFSGRSADLRQVAEMGEDHSMLSRKEMETALRKWHQAWADHDLDGVMELFHEDVLFENWSGGKADGRESLRWAWSEWFAHHWQLEWPSIEKGCEGKPEKRRGVDVMHFKDGKIIRKLTYSKTTLEIDAQRVRLLPGRLK
jgi:hypothetical protein